MNQKQLITLLVLVAVLGGAGLLVYNKKKESYVGGNASAARKVIGDLPVNDVVRLAIKQDTNEVNLVKKDDLWRVVERSSYPANFTQISGLLLKLRDLKVGQSEKVGPSQLAKLQLAPGQGTNSPVTLQFGLQGDKPGPTLLLGKPHLKKSAQPSPYGDDGSWPDGRYVKAGNSEEVALVSDPLELQTKPEAWLNKDFIKVEKPKSIEVTFAVATNSWKLVRTAEAAEWSLVTTSTNELLDPAKASGVSSPLSSPTFSDVLPGDKIETTGTNSPVVVKIETFDHFNYTVRVGTKTNEDYLVTVAVSADLPKERAPGKDEKPEDKARLDKEFKDRQQKLEDKLKLEQGYSQWTYLVQSWSLDPLLQEREQLLKKDEPKKEGENGASAEKDEELKIEDPQIAPANANPKQ